MSSKWSVVVPSNRPEKLKDFLEAWQPLFDKYDVNLIVVEDSPKGWKGIPDFIPRRTDMIRSWGFYLAWGAGSDYTLTLDDDTRPIGDPFAQYEREFTKGRPFSKYFSVGQLTTADVEMRGFPYKDRRLASVGVQYGGWDGVMDFDAPTQLAVPQFPFNSFTGGNIAVPVGSPTTCCIMNCAFKTSLTPIMWQLPMLEGKYNRFGDIWSGLFIKKALDGMGEVLVINGYAVIAHERASNPFANIVREAPGMEINEGLWDALSGETYREITDSAAEYFAGFDPAYAKHFKESRDLWLKLYE